MRIKTAIVKIVRKLIPVKFFNRLETNYQKKKVGRILEGRRIFSADVNKIISKLKAYPKDKVAILTDQDEIVKKFADEYPIINCREFGVDLSRWSIFIYACENADIGIPYIKKIIGEGKKFFPVDVGTSPPASYLDDDIVAKSVLMKLFPLQKDENFCKFAYGPGADFINICQMLERTKNIRGAFVEVGCYRGSSGQVAVLFMNQKKIFRRAIFIDVFDGFNYDDARSSADAMWVGTHQTEGLEVVSSRLKRYSLPDAGLTVEVRKANIIIDNCLDDVPEIALANVDVDIYDAVKVSLYKIYPKLMKGGAIIVEDPGHQPALIGARVALDEFMGTLRPDEFTILQMESGQFILFKF